MRLLRIADSVCEVGIDQNCVTWQRVYRITLALPDQAMGQDSSKHDLNLYLAIGQASLDHTLISERFTRLPDVNDWILPSSLSQVTDNEKSRWIVWQVV